MISDFVQDGFLHKKLGEFLEILANHHKVGEKPQMAEWLTVLVAGCHINEIEKRLALGAELPKNWPEYFANGPVDWQHWGLYAKKWQEEEMGKGEGGEEE